jgi:hypothetical protein
MYDHNHFINCVVCVNCYIRKNIYISFEKKSYLGKYLGIYFISIKCPGESYPVK